MTQKDYRKWKIYRYIHYKILEYKSSTHNDENDHPDGENNYEDSPKIDNCEWNMQQNMVMEVSIYMIFC